MNGELVTLSDDEEADRASGALAAGRVAEGAVGVWEHAAAHAAIVKTGHKIRQKDIWLSY